MKATLTLGLRRSEEFRFLPYTSGVMVLRRVAETVAADMVTQRSDGEVMVLFDFELGGK